MKKSAIIGGKPTVTRNQFGQGQAIYLGAFGKEVFYDDFFGWLLKQKRSRVLLKPPQVLKSLSVGRVKKGCSLCLIILMKHMM
jgi:beta-galactosidase GanA